MYGLYRVQKSGAKQLVGYYDTPADAGCAIDDDARKFDDGAAYELERLKDDAE